MSGRLQRVKGLNRYYRPIRQQAVELGCDAVTLGSGCLLPPLSFGGAQVPSPSLRFHMPLIDSYCLVSDRRSAALNREGVVPSHVRKAR